MDNLKIIKKALKSAVSGPLPLMPLVDSAASKYKKKKKKKKKKKVTKNTRARVSNDPVIDGPLRPSYSRYSKKAS
tara:strand:+ start:994 stop:1218 length:225 start_codon:yes stop_codon:yes gene_type:complete